jgi:hypothetical protein
MISQLSFERLIFLAVMMLCGTVNGEYPSPLSDIRPANKAGNCGIWVTAFTLGVFQSPFEMSKLAVELDTNDAWDEPVDMSHIKVSLEKAGLHTEAFKKATSDEVFEKLSHAAVDSVAILHLKNRPNRVGHFVVLMAPNQNRELYIDVGRPPEWVSANSLKAKMNDDFSGLFLFVSSTAPPEPVFILDGSPFILNAGEQVLGPGMWEVSVKVKNPSDQPIALQNTKGSCQCFKKATINASDGKTIPAHGTAMMTLTFDRAMFGVGSVENEVLLSFSGMKSVDWIEVTVAAHVSAESSPLQLTWFPEAINIAAVERAAIQDQEFTIFTPPGVAIGEPQTSTPILKISGFHKETQEEDIDEAGRTVHRFKIDMKNLPLGPLREKVTLTTSDKNTPRIEIPLSGEVRK